jgi:hypothetical protein
MAEENMNIDDIDEQFNRFKRCFGCGKASDTKVIEYDQVIASKKFID